MNERDHSGNLDTNGKIILKCVLKNKSKRSSQYDLVNGNKVAHNRDQ
jgi:hypothetical protein